MINVLLERTKSGALIACKADGHAQYARKGFDIVCSAVSVLIKTTLLVMEDISGIELETELAERGHVSFRVKSSENISDAEEKLKFAGEFLEKGLGSISEEYPDNLSVMYTTV